MQPVCIADFIDVKRKNDHDWHDHGVELVFGEAIEAEGACAEAPQVRWVVVTIPQAAVEGGLCRGSYYSED